MVDSRRPIYDAPQLTVRPYAMPAMYRFLPHFSLTCALGKADVRSVSWVSSIGRRRGTEITKADCGSNKTTPNVGPDVKPWSSMHQDNGSIKQFLLAEKCNASQQRETACSQNVNTVAESPYLVGGGCTGRDAEACIPSPMDALARVLEVQLHTLVDEACVS